MAKENDTQKKKQKRVIIFTTPSCPHCNHAKRYLRERGIHFRDVDVSRDPAAARDMVRRSGQQGVPVIDIGGKIVIGFNKAEVDRLLDLR
ncbi:MAG: glutaredoxin family protein [Aggregatilineaceae bacterium]